LGPILNKFFTQKIEEEKTKTNKIDFFSNLKLVYSYIKNKSLENLINMKEILKVSKGKLGKSQF